MTTKAKILIGIGIGAVLTTLGIVGYKKGWFTKKTQTNPTTTRNAPTSEDWKDLVIAFEKGGADVFKKPSNLAKMDVYLKGMKKAQENYYSKFSKEQSNDFKKLVAKGEKNWNADEKRAANEYLKLLIGINING